MRLPHLNMRRLTAAIAITGAGVLIPAIALASPGSTAAAGHLSVAAARCPAGHLTDWVGVPGDGTAGSTYYMLELSNTSHTTCTLFGFPGVSAVGAGGHQLGSTAQRSHYLSERLLTLRPDQTAHVVLQITDVSNFSAGACHPATAVGLRVYAPGAFTSRVVPFAFRACASHGPAFLHVTTTIGGTGIPGVGN
jgi:Protein of unknown function (DUF4232)